MKWENWKEWILYIPMAFLVGIGAYIVIGIRLGIGPSRSFSIMDLFIVIWVLLVGFWAVYRVDHEESVKRLSDRALLAAILLGGFLVLGSMGLALSGSYI